MEINLKPCPFCGSKAALDEMTYYKKYMCAVVCTNKDCRVSAIRTIFKYYDKQSAIEAWNKRAGK